MTAVISAPTIATTVDVRRVQRRTVAVLILSQMVGGIGVAIGITVGALLAARMGGTQISGLGQSAMVVGAALLAVPVTRLMSRRGRRPGLALAYAIGAIGAVLVVLSAARGWLSLLFVGMFLFGGGNAANYQARYSAVDLAEPSRRGRQLSWVVWATTIGSVAGPNLAALADESVRRFGAVTDSGPFVFSAIAFGLAAMVVLLLLRPDPLLLARERTPAAGGSSASATRDDAGPDAPPGARVEPVPDAARGMRAAMREVAASPAARLGIAAVAVGHAVMIGVMSMTPVHIGHDKLRIVGLVLSLHIAGMYALSPVTGWLTDRLGRRPVILGALGVLIAACAVAGTAGHDTVRLSIGLSMLGLGWSGTMVAGSTLLSESVAVTNRASVQGLSDLVMGLGAASAAALSGVVVGYSSYETLAVLAAIVTVPLVALALRPVALAQGRTG